MANHASADRNMLFGILALQCGIISRDQLVAAMHDWLLNKSRPIGQILLDQKALKQEDLQLLEPLVARHIANHAGDSAKSLAAVGSASSVRDFLKQEFDDVSVQASLMHIGMGTTDDRGLVDHGTIDYQTAAAGSRFRILRPLAKGGLGLLSVALDEELHREVALKEIQARHADQAEKRARFMAEAEITGGLEHPGIVPVYGLGAYPDGRPYYAMRYIRGHSLNDAIKRYHAQRVTMPPAERNLTFRNLIGRLIDVCQAIQYAHHRGVLHRDLKPGNIMLGKYGETLVVDWGLAKAGVKHDITVREHADTYETQSLHLSGSAGQTPTVMGAAMGTPDFMSPEQAAGKLDEMGPATDIYGIGATLYALLTGRPAVQATDVNEVIALVQQGDFPKPCSIDASVPPALEAVCLKAMAKRPHDRYATARDLGNDLENWLADEPVSCFTEPWSQRMHRWLRRHKTLVSTGAALLITSVIALTVGLVAVKAEQQRTEQQRRDAVAAKEQAEATKKLARDIIVQTTGNDAIVTLATQENLYPQQKRYLKNIAAYYEQLAPDGATDEETQVASAGFLTRAVRVLHTMKASDDALDMARKAVVSYTRLATDYPDNLSYRHSLAKSLTNLGNTLSAKGEYDAAEAELRKALDHNASVLAQTKSVVQLTMERARIITQLSLVLRKLKKDADAKALIVPEITRLRQLIALNAENIDLQFDLGNLLSNLGQADHATNQPIPAAKSYREAIDIFQKLSDQHPTVQKHAKQTALNLGNLGSLLAEKEPEQAATAFRQALTLAQQRANFPMDHDAYREYCENLGIILCRLNKVEEAAKLTADCEKFQDLKGSWSYTATLILCRCATAEPAKAKQHTDFALAKLQLAIEHGFDDGAALEKDEALKPLRDRPEFAALVEKAKARMK